MNYQVDWIFQRHFGTVCNIFWETLVLFRFNFSFSRAFQAYQRDLGSKNSVKRRERRRKKRRRANKEIRRTKISRIPRETRAQNRSVFLPVTICCYTVDNCRFRSSWQRTERERKSAEADRTPSFHWRQVVKRWRQDPEGIPLLEIFFFFTSFFPLFLAPYISAISQLVPFTTGEALGPLKNGRKAKKILPKLKNRND